MPLTMALIEKPDRFAAFAGSRMVGMIESVADQWVWSITRFYAPLPETLARYGNAKSPEAALPALEAAWQAFVAFAEMESGALRLVRQEDLTGGAADYHVLAGGFLLGRIYEDRAQAKASWFWGVTGLIPADRGSAQSREQAMADIKAAWLSYCRSVGAIGE